MQLNKKIPVFSLLPRKILHLTSPTRALGGLLKFPKDCILVGLLLVSFNSSFANCEEKKESMLEIPVTLYRVNLLVMDRLLRNPVLVVRTCNIHYLLRTEGLQNEDKDVSSVHLCLHSSIRDLK